MRTYHFSFAQKDKILIVIYLAYTVKLGLWWQSGRKKYKFIGGDLKELAILGILESHMSSVKWK